MRTSVIDPTRTPPDRRVADAPRDVTRRSDTLSGLNTRTRPDTGASETGGTTVSPWFVVALWATLLGLLAGVGAAFGNSLFVLEVSGSAAAFVALLAVAVWLHQRLRPHRRRLPHPTRIGGVILLAVAAALAWLGLAFGGWTIMLAGVALLAALGVERAAHRHNRRIPIGTATARPSDRQATAASTRSTGSKRLAA